MRDDPIRQLGWRRRLRMVATALGLTRAGIWIPYRHADRLAPVDYPAVAELFRRHEATFLTLLVAAEGHLDDLARFGGPPPAPRLDQGWFPRLDLAVAYALVRRRRPRTLVEIGCGHSTRVLARARVDGGLATRHLCIDPAPRADIAALEVEHLPRRLEEVEDRVVAALGPGDVLFVDSSHLALPGSDVDRIFLRILPRLPAGVLVHVHDVFLPDPYPAAWRWRGYGEQSLLAAWLLAGGLEPLFSSHWITTRCRERWQASPLGALPRVEDAPECSLWAVLRTGGAQRAQKKVSGR